MKLFIFVSLVFALAGCSDDNYVSTVQYKIENESVHPTFSKSNLDIRLDKKISEKDLQDIANELRRDRTKYERLWIGYYLPGMKVGSGSWATTHFTPELEVQILGSTAIEDDILKAVSIEAGTVLGKWEDQRTMVESSLILYEHKGKIKLKSTYTDGSFSDRILTKKNIGGRVRYDYLESFHGEYFMVEENGNLGMYGNNGKFTEAVKVN